VIRLRTTSAGATVEAGEALGRELRAGDVVLLAGGLGAGKTTFVKGLARGLDVEEVVTSPAFVLVRSYEGRLPLVHLDVYRLDRLQEVVDLGVAELADDGGVMVVEWGDVVAPALPAEVLEVRLSAGGEEDERHLALTWTDSGSPAGSRWRARAERLGLALEAWSEPARGAGSPC